jgi:preprotein translocase subunit YajC
VLISSGSVAVAHVAASKNNSSSGFINLIFLLLIVGAVVLFMRRGRARQRAVVETRNNVAPGVEVVTTAGLIATVVDSDDETVTLEIAPGVQSRFVRQAIARVVVPPSPEAPPDYPASEEPRTPEHPDDAPPEGTH